MTWAYCNETAETQPISEIPLSTSSDLTFHQLAIIISFSSGSAAILLSFFLIWMHALHYTKPIEQKNIIRILLMVPIYSASTFLQLVFYRHAVYYAVISDCYEAFAISSFFQLMCQYIAPTLHEQKQFFRQLQPIKPWVWPLNWFAKCCGGARGPWRTPKSGLTWFNIMWIGVYHYCFIRVSMTIVAVVTEHYKRYCESSMSPLFSHVWVLVIESIAVAIAMYCVIQYYVQFKVALAYHKPFLKVFAIKGVIFLSFWQSSAISIASTEFNIISVNAKLAYPDISTGIPAMLLSVEMFFFAVTHIWAYPWKAYRVDAPQVFYPSPTGGRQGDRLNEPGPPMGGFMGLGAIVDALNFWDVIKAFGRGLRWLFWGVKHRHQDISYQKNSALADMEGDGKDNSVINHSSVPLYPYTPHQFPAAGEHHHSAYAMNQHSNSTRVPAGTEEGAGLIAHAAEPSMPLSHFRAYGDDRDDAYGTASSDLGYRGASSQTMTGYPSQTGHLQQIQQSRREATQQAYEDALATESDYAEAPAPRVNMTVMAGREEDRRIAGGGGARAQQQPSDMQRQIGAALWGQNPHQHPDGPMI